MSKTLADKPTITGDLVELRPFDSEATEAMLSFIKEPDVLKRTGTVHSTEDAKSGAPGGYEHARRWYETRNEQTDRIDLAVFSLNEKKYVGEAVLNEYDAADQSLNYRILIGSAGQSKGYGTEATRLLVDYAFRNLDIERIRLEVFDFNAHARYVYTSVGFTEIERVPDALIFDGKTYDSIIKEITRADFQKFQPLKQVGAAA
ncbi:GNAT family N-acetyltransferase [Rothia sp. ZJ1223]|uniref:GNAT family N-acetyltransferase n=1 Tax=Rothia sp. ZJ1223 TaxID=2811098 RepID=UPI0019572F06|nr:GNAT family protein [Rothia sp. ZJ1223]MBM7051348.1 GNAT family N-acetyltransferase [Rothia sp. ZJ1223]